MTESAIIFTMLKQGTILAPGLPWPVQGKATTRAGCTLHEYQPNFRIKMETKEADPLLKAAYGKSVFEAAANNPVPDTAWEFHIRK